MGTKLEDHLENVEEQMIDMLSENLDRLTQRMREDSEFLLKGSHITSMKLLLKLSAKRVETAREREKGALKPSPASAAAPAPAATPSPAPEAPNTREMIAGLSIFKEGRFQELIEAPQTPTKLPAGIGL